MTTEIEQKVDSIITVVLGWLQILVFIALAYGSISTAIAQSIQLEQEQDVQNQRIVKLETQLESKAKEVDKNEEKIEALQSSYIQLRSSVDNILKLLYWISAAIGSVLLELSHRLLRPVLKKVSQVNETASA